MSKQRIAVVVFGFVFLWMAGGAVAGVQVGVEGGYGYSRLTYDEELDIWDAGWDHGFSLGGFLAIDAGLVGVRTGARFVRYKNRVDIPRVEDELGWIEGEFDVTQDYIAVPVLVELNLLPGPGLFLVAGPEFGFLSSAEQHLVLTTSQPASGPQVTAEKTENITDRLDDTNLSIIVGAGIALPLGGIDAIVQVRYNHGLKGTAVEEEWLSDWTTRAFELIVGIGF